jgi:serine/threonine protein kinase
MGEQEQSPIPPGSVINGYVIGEPLVCPTPNSWVYDATSQTGAGKFVFKYIRPEVAPHLIDAEVQANQQVAGCPHAVVGFDFVSFGNTVGYFMDKFARGDLLDFVVENALGEADIAVLAHQILEALDWLHGIGIAHRDVKLENVLLAGDGARPDAFLCDFGFAAARDADAGEFFTEPVGSKPYCAPELLRARPYTEAVDMWAFGVVLYVLFARQMPFPDAAAYPNDYEYQVITGDWFRELLADAGASEEAVDLVDSCLQVDPANRLVAAEALRHPFFARIEEDVKAGVGVIEGALTF